MTYMSEYMKKWRARNPDYYRTRGPRSPGPISQARKDKLREYNAARYLRIKDEVKIRSDKWHKDNPEYCRANAKARQKRARSQKPACVAWSELTEVYRNCPDDMVVDHIVPLIAKRDGIQVACGLHAPWNLEYKTSQYNLSKGCNIDYKG